MFKGLQEMTNWDFCESKQQRSNLVGIIYIYKQSEVIGFASVH